MQSHNSFAEDDPMGRNENPWTKFFHADYHADMARKRCSLAARGFWMEALACFMCDETDRFEGPIWELAGMTSCRVEEAEACVKELLERGVASGEFECPKNVRLISRRIEKHLSYLKSERERKARSRSKDGVRDLSEDCPAIVRANSPSVSVHDSDSVSSSGSGAGIGGAGERVLSKRQPDGHFPRPDYSPEFMAFGKAYREATGGIFDMGPAWTEWLAMGFEGEYKRQDEVCEKFREQGEWRKWAAEEKLRVPSPCKLSVAIRDMRWEDAPWSAELKKLIDEMNEPQPLNTFLILEARTKAADAERMKALESLNAPANGSGDGSGRENGLSAKVARFRGISSPAEHEDFPL